MAVLGKLRINPYIFTLALCITIYTILLNTAVYLQYKGLKQIQDFPDYLSTIYLTSRGDIFAHYVPWFGQTEKMPFWGAHIAPVLLLFAGIYRLAGYPMILFLLQIFCVGLTSVAIFYIVKERLGSQLASFIIALSFLLYQPAMSAVVTTFQPENFSMPLLAFMFLSLIRKRYGWCIFLSMLLLSLKENMGFIVSMFGVYAFFKSNKKLGLFMFIFGLLWSAFSIGLIIPHFRQGRPAQSLLWFGHLGGDWREIASNLAFHPLSAISSGLREYWPLKAGFQWYMLGPLLYLPLLCPEVLLIALPVIGQIYLARHHLMPVSLCYYHASLDPLLFIAAIYGIARISAGLEYMARKFNAHPVCPVGKTTVLFAAAAILAVNLYITIFRSQFFDIARDGYAFALVRNPVYIVSERDGLIWQALEEYPIPQGASVATSFPFFEAFAGRQRTSDLAFYEREAPDYIFLDSLNYKFGEGYNLLSRVYLKGISEDPRYRQVFEEQGLFIFKREPEFGSGDLLQQLDNFSWMSYLN